MKNSLLLSLPLMALATSQSLSSTEIECSSGITWESKYVAEGRDDLDGSGIFAAELIGGWNNFEAGILAIAGSSEDYEEYDFWITYGGDWNAIDWTLGFVHLEFRPDSANDEEFFIELERPLPFNVVAGGALVYSTEARGSFFEFSLHREIELEENRLKIIPYLLSGFDLGYRTEAHDGPNHLQIGVELEHTLSERIALTGHLAHSFALGDIDREGLGDVSWAGLGIALQL